ncbi:hypothetical protein, partial [Clostridium tarantellae]
MLKVTQLEFLVRGMPECMLLFLAAYAIKKSPINKKKYFISVIIMAVTVYFIRLLPISYGVHTILSLFLFIILSVYINKIDLTTSIKAGIITFIIQIISEIINVGVIKFVLNKNINDIFSHPTLKILYGVPSTLI